MFLTQNVRESGLPFYSAKNQAYLATVIADLNLGKNRTWHDAAWADYLYWQSQDKKTLKRINSLLKDIERNPYDGIGKP